MWYTPDPIWSDRCMIWHGRHYAPVGDQLLGGANG
jgi:hypothetical protein